MTNAPIAEIAARAGVSQEAAAVAVLWAQFDADAQARAEIEEVVDANRPGESWESGGGVSPLTSTRCAQHEFPESEAE